VDGCNIPPSNLWKSNYVPFRIPSILPAHSATALALSQRFHEETRRELGISDDKAYQWGISDWAIGE